MEEGAVIKDSVVTEDAEGFQTIDVNRDEFRSLSLRLQEDGFCFIPNLVPELLTVAFQRKVLSLIRKKDSDTSCMHGRKGWLIEIYSGDVVEGKEFSDGSLFKDIQNCREVKDLFSFSLIRTLKGVLRCKEIEFLDKNAWLRLKGDQEKTNQHADVFFSIKAKR